MSREEIGEILKESLKNQSYHHAFWGGYAKACNDMIQFLDKSESEGLQFSGKQNEVPTQATPPVEKVVPVNKVEKMIPDEELRETPEPPTPKKVISKPSKLEEKNVTELEVNEDEEDMFKKQLRRAVSQNEINEELGDA